MIPYFEWNTIQFGPLTIQVWGVFVAIGILLGAWLSARFAERRGFSKQIIYDAAFWIILAAFVGARLAHVFLYEPAYYLAQPLEILMFWQGGFSVIGGFIGAVIAFFLFVRTRRMDVAPFADALIYGLPLGLGCGRIGCFLIHDHPGTATDFFLGVQRENGESFHDHGLYLAISGFLLAALFWIFSRRKLPDGFFVAVFLIWYGAIRFLLDFWRLIDTRYLGLTPAQYASMLMLAGGLILMISIVKKPSSASRLDHIEKRETS